MKKSTKITAIILLVCLLGIGMIGLTKNTKQSKSSMNSNKKNGTVAITITGADQMILDREEVTYSSQTVYEVLEEVCDSNHIAIETKGTGKIIYISAIDGLSEFDYGANSGWTYTVNGEYPSVGCGAYELKEGDEIEWIYFYE